MTTLRIGIVAGEASGDILGAGLMRSLKRRYPDITFEGIGGPLMLAEGFNSFYPMDRLSVMGLIEPLMRLSELLSIRRHIKQHFTDTPPDLFIGIDSPDFTLNIELALRDQGVLTAHYVSPSVWAWRQGRVKKIAKAVDRMLTLLPFEAEFYQQHNVPVTFVGHPLADEIALPVTDLVTQKSEARQLFSLESSEKVVALLPGSRGGEVNMLGEAFIETASWCLQQRPDLKFIIPAANAQRKEQIELMLQAYKDLPITLVEGQSKKVMLAADVVLMASGTTTLEALLLKKPMVVAYRMSRFTFFIISRLVKSSFIALPNLLAGKQLVPELLQDEVCAEKLGPLVLERIDDNEQRQQLTDHYTAIHQRLKLNASDRAADILLQMIDEKAAKS